MTDEQSYLGRVLGLCAMGLRLGCLHSVELCREDCRSEGQLEGVIGSFRDVS